MTQIDISTAWSPSCNTYFGSFSTYNINVIFTVSIELSIQTSMTIFMITDLPCICNVFTFTVCLAFAFRSCNFYRIAVYNNILIFGYVYCDIFYFCSFVAYCYRCTCCFSPSARLQAVITPAESTVATVSSLDFHVTSEDGLYPSPVEPLEYSPIF